MPTPKKCDPGGCLNAKGPTPGCTYLPEVAPDPTLPVPKMQPYLGSFTNMANAGPPFCTGVWYAYRYVTPDGGYSPLSSWSGTDPTNPKAPPSPIYGGYSNLPCPPGGCGKWGVIPSATCTANAPEMVLIGSIPNLPDGTFLNVHRQSGAQFVPGDEGEIVGSFNVGPQQGFPEAIVAFFVDVMDNPDPKSMVGTCCSS